MAFAVFYTIFSFFGAILLFSSLIPVNASEPLLSTYVVHTDIDSKPSRFLTQVEWHSFMIESLIDRKIESVSYPRISYTYDTVLQGFAARLTDEEAENFAKFPGVLGILKDSFRIKLDTTRSPEFLGLNEVYGLWPESNFGEDVIIGLVDSGIWPESESFKDDGLGPVPSRWRGKCEEGIQFNSSNCNKKLIGAKSFLKWGEGYKSNHHHSSPRDEDGHGTHTASTAAGAEVEQANIFGFANGKARGIARKARIAMYRACSVFACLESDILAAIESAIKDGVDILSLSIGYQDSPYYENAIAIGAFAAMRKGIFVVCSAGNLGPHVYSVHNTAPWVTTVGAGSIDRSFPVQILLGNNKTFIGSSLYPGKLSNFSAPLAFLGRCTPNESFSLNVMGKIAVCNSSKAEAFRNGRIVKEAGGAGLIQLNYVKEGEGLRAIPYSLPSATLGYKESLELISYIKSRKSPIAMFRRHNLTRIGKDRAPIVLSFSARGPNVIVSEILKPDLIAPGLNILAAWPSNISPTHSLDDPRRITFNIDSGTSMSCPHVAGIAALLHGIHPNWSPAAIRSALMTTSITVDNKNRTIVNYEDMKPATPNSVGAGHVNPQLAADPGLIYDAYTSDYINLLCSLNYTSTQMKILTGESICCGGIARSPGDLNYPSFSVVFKNTSSVQEFKRTVTHVGKSLPETYTLKVVNSNPGKFIVNVMPEKLVFNEALEKQSYMVKFESKYVLNSSISIVEQMVFGSISWESDLHIVRSPISIMWDK